MAVEIAIEQGKVPWDKTPPGFIRGRDSRLTIDESVASIIRQAFQLRASGATVAAVRRYLADHGIERGYNATQTMLKDRLYIGQIHFPGKPKPGRDGRMPADAETSANDRPASLRNSWREDIGHWRSYARRAS